MHFVEPETIITMTDRGSSAGTLDSTDTFASKTKLNSQKADPDNFIPHESQSAKVPLPDNETLGPNSSSTPKAARSFIQLKRIWSDSSPDENIMFLLSLKYSLHYVKGCADAFEFKYRPEWFRWLISNACNIQM
jgi:hypothetical protein